MSAYGALAGVYDRLTGDVGYERRADYIEKQFGKSRIPVRTVLDLACGTGTMTWLLTQRGYEVIGVDGSPRMLELARRRFGRASDAEDAEDGAGVSLRIGELDHLPLRDGEADFACINLVLHHLSHPEAAIREMARVLRPGGVVLVTDFDRHQDETMRNVYGDRWLGFTREELTTALKAAGLEPVDCRRREVKMGLALHLVLARKRGGAF